MALSKPKPQDMPLGKENIRPNKRGAKSSKKVLHEKNAYSSDDDFMPRPKKKIQNNIDASSVSLILDNATSSSDEFEVNDVNGLNTKKEAVYKTVAPRCDQAAHLHKLLQDILPMEYEHKVLIVEKCSVAHEVNPGVDPAGNFRATVRVNLRSEEDAREWLDHLKASSFLNFTIVDTYKSNTMKIIYKKGYSCHLNTNPGNRFKTHHAKHIKCPGYLMVTVKNFNMKECSDKYLKSHPAEIQIHFCHNHPIIASDALRHRKPNPGVVQKLRDLFSKGHSPSSALQLHKYDLQLEHGNDFFKFFGDGFHCPKLQWCYHQFYKSYREVYGSFTGDKLYEALEFAVNDYNKNMGSECAKLHMEGNEVIVAICTPLMKRVHSLKASGEIAFVDTAGCVDRDNFRILLMVTYSICGALPLGLIILSSESDAVLTKGLNILFSILPEESFHGRGKQGPAIFLTDDCTALRNSLRNLFVPAVLLLCKFHVLQAFWDYVWDSQHSVQNMEDRRTLFFLFKGILNQETKEGFEEAYGNALQDEILKKYEKVMKHLRDLYPRASEWAMCFRASLITRGNDTNNYVESNFRTLKDIVMQRCKAFTVVQLLDFLTSRFPAYYERRICDVLNNCQTNYSKSKYFFSEKKLRPIDCEVSEKYPNQYDVFNSESKKSYVVDMELESCSCPAGRGGAPCKHLCAVVQKYNLSSSQILSFSDAKMKLSLHFVMTGTLENVPDTWYQSIKRVQGNVDSVCDSVQAVPDQGSDQTDERVQPDEPLDEGCNNEEARSSRCQELLKQVFNHLESSVESAPDIFIPAVEKFCEKYLKTVSQQSQNALTSALHSFNSNLSGPKSMLSGRYIKVSNKAIARRQVYLGGTKLQRSGRPTKHSHVAEHGYGATSKSTAARKLPHHLSTVVDQKTKKKFPTKKTAKKQMLVNTIQGSH